MAGGGIFRTVMLALDRNAAKRMQEEAQRALDTATDPKKAKENLKQATAYLAQTESAVKKLGAAFAAVFAFQKVANFFRDSVRASNEAGKVWRVLGASVKAAGVEFERVRPDLEKAAKALQAVSNIDDEGFATILQELIARTGDFDKSLKNVDLTARVAATFFNGDFAAAADVVGKALNGNVTALNKLIGASANAEEGLRKLSDRSSHDVDQFQQVANSWNDIKEAIGDALKEASGGPSVLQQLIGGLQSFARWIQANQAGIKSFGSAIGDIVTWMVEMVRGLKALNFELASLFRWTGLKSRNFGGTPAAGAPPPPSQIATLAPVVVEVHPLTSAEKRAIEDRAKEAARIAEKARLEAALFSTRMVTMNDLPGMGIKPIGIDAGLQGEGAITGARDQYIDALGLIERQADTTAESLGALAVAFADGGALGIGRLAGMKMKENFAWSVEELAKGIGALWLNPAEASTHFKSAAEHAAAIGAWGLVSAAAGGGGGGGGGGGRSSGGTAGGYPAGARDPGGRSTESMNTDGPEIHIHLDPISKNNPMHQAEIAKTVAEYSKRGGKIIFEGAA